MVYLIILWENGDIKQVEDYVFKHSLIENKLFWAVAQAILEMSDPNTKERILIEALISKNYMVDLRKSGFEVASRTDRYVSARGSAFSFITTKKPILMEINSALPREIGLWAHVKVPKDFLSRYNALYRHYKYIIYYDNRYNLKLMKKACKFLWLIL